MPQNCVCGVAVIKGVLEMKILLAASEALPFAASGGLADVAGSLPAALSKNSEIDCRVVMPLYRSVTPAVRNKMTYLKDITVEVGWRKQYCGIYTIQVGKVTYYLLDNPYSVSYTHLTLPTT